MESHKPQKKTQRESQRTRKKTIITVLLLLFVIGDFIWIMNHRRFKVSEISIEGNQTIPSDDIQKIVDNYLETELLWSLPHNNVLLTNTQRLARDIKNAFPKVYETDIVFENGSDIKINIEEREPHSLWCKNENYISVFDEECYYADQKGYIYARSPYFSPGVFSKIYTNNERLKIGEQVLNKEDFEKFFVFTESLNNEDKISVDRVFLDAEGNIRMYMTSLLDVNFVHRPYLVYKHNESYDVILRNISLMINHEQFKKEFYENAERLEFIDVRIDDQIRYKFTPAGMMTPHQLELIQEKENQEKEEISENIDIDSLLDILEIENNNENARNTTE